MLLIFVEILIKMNQRIGCILMILATFFACESDKRTVLIGKDEWMIKNLSVSKFNNGDPIPEAKTEAEWLEAGQNKSAAWCFQNNDPKNEKKYGRLYNYYAVSDPRGLIPPGFHLATDAEWKNLIDASGGAKNAGRKLKDSDFWGGKNSEVSSGFNARPGGVRIFDGGFSNLENSVYFWTSTQESTVTQFYYRIQADSDQVDRNFSFINYGMYLRCVKDK